ncbi:MAG TPA: alpha/beta fold hydrolase, partial [Hyphomicrobiaceae bacterium]|nr:alpha/beta fold hydrolase [Hyphomicrobiaceae bacterium]
MKATINSIALNYEVSGPGSAPPVVLHHPIATNLSVWDELAAAIEPRYRVIRFDARGHGQSEAPKGRYSFATLTQDVIGLMDHLGIGKSRFVGLSMGGMVGQYLGLLHPHRFYSLCLVSTTSAVPAQARPLWEERIRNAGTLGMASVVDGSLSRWVAPGTLETKPALVARLKAMIVTTPPDGYIGWCHAIRDLDITDRLNEVKLPTRVIVGALDPATPPAMAEVIHHAIAGSDLAVMPGVSHMLHVEAPDAFHKHVMPFLAAHGPA